MTDYGEYKKTLLEFAKIRDKRGYFKRDIPETETRETIILQIVRTLKKEMILMRKGVVTTNLCWKAPIIGGLRPDDYILEDTAKRIAWEMFPEQIQEDYRERVIGFQNDPFYEKGRILILTDTERIAIEVGKASAEKRYRDLLRRLRICHRIKDPSELP